MQRVFSKTARWLLVSVGTVLLTSVTVDATFNSGGISQSALGIFATKVTEKGCPDGTVAVRYDTRNFCIDMYEVSAGAGCEYKNIQHSLQTEENIDTSTCTAQSKVGMMPWTYVTYHQASELCARRGMRLPTHAEWHVSALGTLDPEGGGVCNLSSTLSSATGDYETCQSPTGAYDMIGNVWEWVEASVVDGKYEDRLLPESGYVVDADSNGVALRTESSRVDNSYHADYFWSSVDGSTGMVRGGFYGSQDDGGVYSIQAQLTRSFAGAAIGFRCLLDI